ncbi:MAG: transposase [Bacteroidales bacterium]|nr:transposase [Bacteroidales bacterium]
MRYNPNIHNRRSIRLKNYDYSQPGLYFITICVRNSKHLFGKIQNGRMILNEYGEIATQCWLKIPQHFPNTILHEFVIMPNHVHGIIQIYNVHVGANNYLPLQPRPKLKHGTSQTIGSIIRGFKNGVTKQLNQFECFGTIWQRNYFEHIIRNSQSYQYIANYIVNNPTTWETDQFNLLKDTKLLQN